MTVKVRWTDLIVVASTFVSFLIIVCGARNLSGGYEPMFVFPIAYLLYYIFAIHSLTTSDYKYTVFAYSLFQWIRFVVMPATMALATNDNSRTSSNVNLAIWLMLVEFLISAVFIYAMSLRHFNKNEDIVPELYGSKLAYYIFAIIALVLFIVYLSRGTRLLNFLILDVGTSGRIGDITDTGLVLVRQVITCAITFTFLSFVAKFSQKYNDTSKIKYLYFSIIAAILVVLVIVGERRSSQIYSSICASYILIRLFKRHSKSIVRWVIGAALVVLIFMSLYKFSYAFLYSSYLDALKASSFSINSFASTLQSYFGGPKNIALAIDYSNQSNLGIGNLFFDFIRSTAPFSFLLKNSGSITSVLFNQYIYGGLQSSGHVLSSTAYGYIYGGFFLCPWVMILNLAFAMGCEKKLKRTLSLEMTYVWMLLMLRFCINLYANTPALLSSASIALLSYGLVYLGSKSVNYTITRRKRL